MTTDKDVTPDSDKERKDLLKVIEVGQTFHLRTWTSYSEDSTTIRAWCGGEFDADDNDSWVFPMQLLDRESLCLECNYEKRKATRERFERYHVPDTERDQ